jgi:uncharacterized protein
MNLLRKYEDLQGIVARVPGVVAFSGGADSSLLLKAAVDVFGKEAAAFFADSVLQTDADRDNAVETARLIDANLRVVEFSPLQWPEFAANPTDRCYLCKKKVYLLFKNLLPQSGMVLYDGSNLDDLRQDRPGRRAIIELDVKTPLVEAGLNKADVRRLGKFLGVPTWNRESASCLATRIPAGTPITAENLGLVVRYEDILIAAGFPGVRARLCADDSRSIKIEIKQSNMEKFFQQEIREKLICRFKRADIDNLWFSLRGR